MEGKGTILDYPEKKRFRWSRNIVI